MEDLNFVGNQVTYKETSNGVFVGTISGDLIQNNIQSAYGSSVDQVIDKLKKQSASAEIPDNVWEDLKDMIKEYGFK